MHIRIDDKKLHVELSFWERVWSIKRSWHIPLNHVAEVTLGKPAHSWKGLRLPGTHLPGVIKAGTFLSGRGREYWYTTGSKKAITIELADMKYKRLILTPEHPEHIVSTIKSALRAHKR